MKHLITFLAVLGLMLVPAYGAQRAGYFGTGLETPSVWADGDGEVYCAGLIEGDAELNIAGAVTFLSTLALTAQLELPDGDVTDPAWTFASDGSNGPFSGGADIIEWTIGGVSIGTFEATGLNMDRASGDTGTVTPGTGSFTDIMGSGGLYHGQDPGDMFTGYRRTETIKFIDGFDMGVDVQFALIYNLTNVVGAGTNEVTSVDGWNTLTTGGAGGPDSEETCTFGLNHYRAYAPRVETVVDFTAIGGTFFAFGFYAAANEYCEIRYDTAVSVNWSIAVDDTGGQTIVDSGVAVTADPTKLELWVDAAGVPGFAIDDVEYAAAGLDPMTVNGHYLRWNLTDIAAAVHTGSFDFIETEQSKVQ